VYFERCKTILEDLEATELELGERLGGATGLSLTLVGALLSFGTVVNDG
jgi:hypothetical protein